MKKTKGTAKTGKNFLMNIQKPTAEQLGKGGTVQKPMPKSKMKSGKMPRR